MSEQALYLSPGEWFFGDRTMSARTLLGSCVSLIVWNPVRLFGGMCHYMLPKRHRAKGELDGRYADEAFELILHEIRRVGTIPSDYHAKLVGGGQLLVREDDFGMKVGEQNIRAGRELVAKYGFDVQGEHLGGMGHRVVQFEVGTGAVWVKHVAPVTKV